MTLINNRLDHLLDDMFFIGNDDFFVKNYKVNNRSCGWSETESGYEHESNLAGFKKKNVKVKAENGILEVSAKQGDKEYLRHYSIPDKANTSSIEARLEDGMLYLKINKKESEKSKEVIVN